MEDNELIHSILSAADIAVLKRVGPENYVPIGEIPCFYR